MTEPTEGHNPDAEWVNPMGDPMLDWLRANSIDLDRIPMFPEIQFDEHGWMKIEFMYGSEEGTPRTNLVMRRPATRMVRRMVVVPMPEELLEVYLRARADYLAELALKIIGRAGATVLTARPGAHLVFVCSNPMAADDGFLEAASAALAEALPGVGVQIMTGVDTILHRAPQEDR